MRVNRAETKHAVRDRLRGCWGRVFLACVLPTLASAVFTYVLGARSLDAIVQGTPASTNWWGYVLSVGINVFVCAPMRVALSALLLQLLRTPEGAPPVSQVFSCFDKGYGRILSGVLAMQLKLELWALLANSAGYLPVLGGLASFVLWIWLINRSFAYMMTPFVLAENPEISGADALRRSIEMTRGSLVELFVAFSLSFLSWLALTAVTVGIASVYVLPYMRTVEAAYYLRMSGQTP
jgi:uncharacterized membrane protein